MLVFNQFSVGWLRLLSQVLHQSCDFLGSDVSLGSQCGCHLRLFLNVYVCGRQKVPWLFLLPVRTFFTMEGRDNKFMKFTVPTSTHLA